jgi:HSP20 family protein
MLIDETDHLLADLIDDGESIHLEIEVPGLEHAVLEVRASGHTVTVSGQRPVSHRGHYLLMERRRSFRRSFKLPDEADMRNLHAHVRDGVLTISASIGAGSATPEGTTVEVRPSIFACHPDAAAI